MSGLPIGRVPWRWNQPAKPPRPARDSERAELRAREHIEATMRIVAQAFEDA